jgi:2-oxoacid:acceptor oxidoreductase delta subunit (pyruvate/2-ketoisovalerate family)
MENQKKGHGVISSRWRKEKGMAMATKLSSTKSPGSQVPKIKAAKIKVPKDREVPFGAITPAPVKQQELFITSNWRIVRPVIDQEKCTRCFTCYIACPDACWSYDEKAEKMEWNWRYCKGCQICIHECPADALKAVAELDFEDGVVRLEKPF